MLKFWKQIQVVGLLFGCTRSDKIERGKRPCSVSKKGVGNNSVLCTLAAEERESERESRFLNGTSAQK